MANNEIFETYLYVSSKKISINVYNKSSKDNVYNKTLNFNNSENYINFEYLDLFLEQNILKIEKFLNNFIKKIYLIGDFDEFLKVQLSIKKNNHENLINSEDLTYMLTDIRDQCKKTIFDTKIIHMIIDSYNIDGKIFRNLPNQIRCNNFSLDVTLICLSNLILKNFEKSLNKYQITLDKIVSASYLRDFFIGKDYDISEMAIRIIQGCNNNEIFLVKKTNKNVGFFEKFFNFFS